MTCTIPINKKQSQEFFNWIEKCADATEVPTSDPDGTWIRQEAIKSGSPFSDLDPKIEQQCFPRGYPLRKPQFECGGQMNRIALNRHSVEWLQQLKWVAAYTDIDPIRLEEVTIRATAQRVQMLHLLEKDKINANCIFGVGNMPRKYLELMASTEKMLYTYPALAICLTAALVFRSSPNALTWIAPIIVGKIFLTFISIAIGRKPDENQRSVPPLLVGVIAPLAEEILFRGLFQSTIFGSLKYLLPKSMSMKISILSSSLLFSDAHPSNRVVTLISGCFYGFLANRYGLGASLLAHIVWNSGYLLQGYAIKHFYEAYKQEELIQKFKEICTGRDSNP